MVTMLDPNNALLLVVDLQEKLMPHIHEHERVAARTVVMIEAAKILGLPVILSEQYRRGLGDTIPAVRAALGDAATGLEKTSFGCLGDAGQRAAIEATGRKQLILVGIEAHVCILQTALAALSSGYTVFLAEDALGSRRAGDRETALKRLRRAGAIPATVEMLIMEALGIAGGEKFKAILPFVREL
jgi:nicotinamidase-related amidase